MMDTTRITLCLYSQDDMASFLNLAYDTKSHQVSEIKIPWKATKIFIQNYIKCHATKTT